MIKPIPLLAYGLLLFALISSSALIGHFPSTSGALADFNFAAAGDWGCRSDTENTVNSIVSKSTELTLSLGDFSYQDSADCWLDMIAPIDNQMKIAIGNHDDETSTMLQQYMDHFGLTQQYYSFDY